MESVSIMIDDKFVTLTDEELMNVNGAGYSNGWFVPQGFLDLLNWTNYHGSASGTSIPAYNPYG
ncbi:hypothetical protein [Lactococcus sp.]|uniref:hypothetical protein n=1 Tax=Lactococcus sp. TaxID=44273 RepID=UPI0035B05254